MERQPFYLTKRKLNSGKSVWYYYYYNQFGERTVPRSTGFTKKADAFKFCVELLKCDNLANNKTKFKTFAVDFFEENSAWYKNVLLEDKIAKGTIKVYRSHFKYHIFPYFSEMFLDRITMNIIKDFRIYLSEVKELSNKTINNVVGTARLIFEAAVDEKLIQLNPINKKLGNLQENEKREAFTLDEIKTLLCKEWEDKESWLYTLTAAITGMRYSEIAGLQEKNIHANYINVCQQFYDGELKETKGKDNRYCTVPERLSERLLEVGKGKMYIFNSKEVYDKPIARTGVIRDFYKAYSPKMLAEKEKRNLTFHSLRYFVNTYLLSNNITETKTNFVLGHSEGKNMMTKLYTTWRPEMFSDILELQNRLLDELSNSGLSGF